MTTQCCLFMTTWRKSSEIIVEKGENAGIQHCLLFPQCFLTVQRQQSLFELYTNCRL